LEDNEGFSNVKIYFVHTNTLAFVCHKFRVLLGKEQTTAVSLFPRRVSLTPLCSIVKSEEGTLYCKWREIAYIR